MEDAEEGQDDDGGVSRGQITEGHVQSKEKGRGCNLGRALSLTCWQKLSVVLTPVVIVLGMLRQVDDHKSDQGWAQLYN